MDTERTPRARGPVPVRSFAVQAAVVLALFTTLVFVGIYWRTQALLEAALHDEASSYIDLIVDARAWNARHGGVWVLKTDGVQSNPFLRALGVEPDTQTVAGTWMTLRNPSAMTVEISRIAAQTNRVTFRLTSTKPVNPANAPDPWELGALRRFESDPVQVSEVQHAPGGDVLRMIRPLYVEESCLRCHASQGYKVGDIRGAVSVSVPMTSAETSLRGNAFTLVLIFAAVVVVGGGIGWVLIARMSAKIHEADTLLRTMAATDSLTGLANRRAVLGRLDEELARAEREHATHGLIMIDIDHFKQVNDTSGHAAGDLVLREVARRLEDASREYDVVGRMGGEEFLVIAPDIEEATLEPIAERLRNAVCSEPIAAEDSEFAVTVSAGATLTCAGDLADDVLARADEALYAAKAAGRNRTRIG